MKISCGECYVMQDQSGHRICTECGGVFCVNCMTTHFINEHHDSMSTIPTARQWKKLYYGM